MYEIILACIQVLMTIWQGFCLQYLYGSFLSGRLKNRRLNSGLTALCFILPKIVMNQQILVENYIHMLGKMLLTLLLLIIIAVCFYHYRRIITIFLVAAFLTFHEIGLLLGYTAAYVTAIPGPFWNWCVNRGYITSADSLSIMLNVTNSGNSMLMFLIWSTVLWLTVRKLVKTYRKTEYEMHRTELSFLLIPVFIGFLICIAFLVLIFAMNSAYEGVLYDKYPVFLIVVPTTLVLCLLSVLYGVRLFQDMIDLHMERSSRGILERQVNDLQAYISETERIHAGIRSMKHDMKNTVSVILSLASGKEETDRDRLQVYLEELSRQLADMDFRFRTGNAVADAILNMKYYEKMQAIPNLVLETEELLFPEDLRVQSYDIGIILGNGMDNALEACGKVVQADPESVPFCRMAAFRKNKMFFIEIENSFDGHIIPGGEGGLPLTDKEDKKTHGIGLLNIKNTVEKYHGALDWWIKGNRFTLLVMMKEEQQRTQS